MVQPKEDKMPDQARSRAKLFDEVSDTAYDKAVNRLNKFRKEYPTSPDWDLLLYALIQEHITLDKIFDALELRDQVSRIKDKMTDSKPSPEDWKIAREIARDAILTYGENSKDVQLARSNNLHGDHPVVQAAISGILHERNKK